MAHMHAVYPELVLDSIELVIKEFEGQVIKGVKAGKGRYYDSCLPIEVMAERGLQT